MRVKTGTVRHDAHKKVLKAAKGFWMSRHKRFKVANEAVMHAGKYAYEGRRIRRRDMRKLWIVRLNAALRTLDTKYSTFIQAMSLKNVQLNRKMLSEISIHDPATFKSIVESVK